MPGRRACRRPVQSRALERGGRELLDRQRDDVVVGPEALEGPRQVGLDWDADGAAGRDDAEQHAYSSFHDASLVKCENGATH